MPSSVFQAPPNTHKIFLFLLPSANDAGDDAELLPFASDSIGVSQNKLMSESSRAQVFNSINRVKPELVLLSLIPVRAEPCTESSRVEFEFELFLLKCSAPAGFLPDTLKKILTK